MKTELRLAMIDQLETRNRLIQADGDDEGGKAMLESNQKLIEQLKAYEDAPDPPKDLTQRVELRNYLTAYSQGVPVRGAEAELNQGMGLDSMTQVPLQALAPKPLEQRTDDPTNLTIADWGKNVQAITPRIFEQTDAGFLGIAMPAVPAGTASYPVMTAGTSGSMQAANAAVEADTATFSVENVTPSRLSARYIINMEGVAAFGTALESTLRNDLRMVMGDALDEQLINGNGTSPNISGVLNELTDPSNPAAEANFTAYRNTATNNLDGKAAGSESAIRVLVGLKTWQHARTKMNSQETMDGIQAAMALGAQWRLSARIPDVVAKRQDGILTWMPTDAVAPVWNALAIIRDPYTGAAKAQTALTAHMLFGFTFKRKDNWKQIRFQVEA